MVKKQDYFLNGILARCQTLEERQRVYSFSLSFPLWEGCVWLGQIYYYRSTKLIWSYKAKSSLIMRSKEKAQEDERRRVRRARPTSNEQRALALNTLPLPPCTGTSQESTARHAVYLSYARPQECTGIRTGRLKYFFLFCYGNMDSQRVVCLRKQMSAWVLQIEPWTHQFTYNRREGPLGWGILFLPKSSLCVSLTAMARHRLNRWKGQLLPDVLFMFGVAIAMGHIALSQLWEEICKWKESFYRANWLQLQRMLAQAASITRHTIKREPNRI